MIRKLMAGCTVDFDGFYTGDCLPAVADINSEENRRGDFAGYHSVDYDYKSSRKDQQFSGMVAKFVDSQDVIPCHLLYALQKKKPYLNFGGYQLTRIIMADEAMVWIDTKGQSAIICLVGQNIAQNSAHLIDDLNIAGATANQACQLRLARVGEELIRKVKEFDVDEIILCGYSLGGSAVACIGEQATRGIIFNGGAPVTNSSRPVPSNCKVYHIVGDILSTHFLSAKRIYLVETDKPRKQDSKNFQTDGIQWFDIGYYHAMDRFMDYGGPYEIVGPQFEQNSLENYFFFKSGELSDVGATIAGILSVNFNFRKKMQMMICSNPVPGSYASRGCAEGGPDLGDKIIGGVFGGLVGGLAGAASTGGPGAIPGAAAGAAAGVELATGEKGILDLINPDIGKTVVNVGEKFVEGASALDALNNAPGKFTGEVAYEESPYFGDSLVVKPRIK